MNFKNVNPATRSVMSMIPKYHSQFHYCKNALYVVEVQLISSTGIKVLIFLIHLENINVTKHQKILFEFFTFYSHQNEWRQTNGELHPRNSHSAIFALATSVALSVFY